MKLIIFSSNTLNIFLLIEYIGVVLLTAAKYYNNPQLLETMGMV